MVNVDDGATSVTLLRLLCREEKDDEAWRLFYQRYQPMIGRWCWSFRLQPADVDDISQKVLERVFTRIRTYDPQRGERFRGWLKTVVENAVKDFLRTSGRRPGDRGSGDSDIQQLLEALAQPATIDQLTDELDTSLRRDVEDAVARVEQAVAPDTMACFRMVMLEGVPIADVAQRLAKSYTAVCMAVQRVKNKLRAEGAQLAGRRSAGG
jgi:RNA polymerase sigma-70 factor (ECF subfamily)